ncbi:MAG: methyltransferase domain-containing protein [Verrucomicrobiia bacterium]
MKQVAEQRATKNINPADWEEVNCPSCGPDAQSRLLFQRIDGHGIRLCLGCGLIFVSPRFTPGRLAAMYEREDYADESVFDNFDYEAWVKQIDYKVHAMSCYKVKAMLVELLTRYLGTGARVLDVGCGFGLTVLEANRRGFDAEGIDLSEHFVALARGKLGLGEKVRQGRLEDLHLADSAYDGVIFWDVLEHVHNPLEILAEIRRILRPGGYLFGQVPNWRGLTNRYKTFLNRHGFGHKQFKHFGIPHHVFNFDEGSLRLMLEKAGFEVVYCRSWSKLKYKINPSPLSRWFHGTLERRNLTDYLVFVAQTPA